MGKPGDGLAIDADAAVPAARGFQLGRVVEPNPRLLRVIGDQLFKQGERLVVISDPCEHRRLQAEALEIPGSFSSRRFISARRAVGLVHLEQQRRIAMAGGEMVRRDREAFLEQALRVGIAFAADRDFRQHPQRGGIARVALQELPEQLLGFRIAVFAKRDGGLPELRLGRQQIVLRRRHFAVLSASA